jgi:hypothetical protein
MGWLRREQSQVEVESPARGERIQGLRRRMTGRRIMALYGPQASSFKISTGLLQVVMDRYTYRTTGLHPPINGCLRD